MKLKQLILFFLLAQRQQLLLLSYTIQLLILHLSSPSQQKDLRRWKQRVRPHRFRPQTHPNNNVNKQTRPQRERNRQLELRCYEDTGLDFSEIMNIFEKVKDDLILPRQRRYAVQKGWWKRSKATSLDPFCRLYLTLTWLRQGASYSFMAAWFGVSKAYVSREIHHIVPLLCTLENISMPPKESLFHHPFEQAALVIDCTALFRQRVHPKQADWYRKDKKGFFLLLQLVCGLDGRWHRVTFFKGRNNDQAAFNMSGLAEWLCKNHLVMLADRGYTTGPNVITPTYPGLSKQQQHLQMALRAVIETNFALLFSWQAINKKFQGPPEWHFFVSYACCQLAASVRLRNPRPILQSISL